MFRSPAVAQCLPHRIRIPGPSYPSVASVLLVTAASCLAVLGLAVLAGGGQSLTVDNTNVRLDTNGNGINAHDGHILIDGNGTYWLFGTRYPDCLESQDHCGWGMGPLWPNGTSRDPSWGSWGDNDFAACACRHSPPAAAHKARRMPHTVPQSPPDASHCPTKPAGCLTPRSPGLPRRLEPGLGFVDPPESTDAAAAAPAARDLLPAEGPAQPPVRPHTSNHATPVFHSMSQRSANASFPKAQH